MVPIQGSVEIHRPVETVFEFLSDLRNAPKWQRGVIESRRTSEGPMRVGTQFRETVRMMGMRFEALCEVTAFDPPRKFSMTADGRLVHYEGDFHFEPIAGGGGDPLERLRLYQAQGVVACSGVDGWAGDQEGVVGGT
jgi:uncharacterized protein YndB with AHSA1/START domain